MYEYSVCVALKADASGSETSTLEFFAFYNVNLVVQRRLQDIPQGSMTYVDWGVKIFFKDSLKAFKPLKEFGKRKS